MAGYHLRDIKRGVFGEASKITEEHEEFIESLEQKNPIMALVELSDLIGAIEGYAIKHHNVTLEDLLVLKDATKRAFNDGVRIAKRG
jgi:hypothetical protein